MQFNSLEAFLSMGGYGVYVWSVYALALLVLGYNVLKPRMMKKRLLRQQKRRLLGMQANQVPSADQQTADRDLE